MPGVKTVCTYMEDLLANSVVVKNNRSNSLINRKMILRILGILLHLEGMMFLVCMCVSLAYGESAYLSFAYSALATGAVAFLFQFLGKGGDNSISRRDGYCIVAFSWMLFTVFGMLPMLLSGEIPAVTDAFFETMSGFTTTGATILDDIESLSHGMLFWRSFTQWIGGLGIVFFTVAFLPIFGLGNQVLFSAEATGVNHDKIHPKVSVMAKWLWTLYLLLTASCGLLLMAGGMDPFDAVCHAFTTAATGGYSTKQDSIAYWNSPFIEYVIAVFMVLAGVNFTLYFKCLKGQFSHLLQNDEVKFYLGTVVGITLACTLSLYLFNQYGAEEAFRKAFFQVASIFTSCGYATDDYVRWAPFTWLLLVYLMLAGGCTGSTCGGIKSMRVLIILKNMRNEFSRLIHPRAVLPVKVNHQAVSTATISTVSTFILCYLGCLFLGWLSLMVMGVGFVESFGVAVSSLGNAGPAFGQFGPAYSWNALPMAGKWLSSFLMLIGRLEIFGILLMFVPSFWHKR